MNRRAASVRAEAPLAAFNTGLVNELYEPIYAVFEPSDGCGQPWVIVGFCATGDKLWERLVLHFRPLPERAHYFDAPEDLIYDTNTELPDLNIEHIIVERIERWPREFVASHIPNGFNVCSTAEFTAEESEHFFDTLGEAIWADVKIYNEYINRLRYAVALGVKKIKLNYKLAVPTYYPRFRKIMLLLPIGLQCDEVVDAAIVVDRLPAGNYYGRTILTLDWAYSDSRLISRHDSDWLNP